MTYRLIVMFFLINSCVIIKKPLGPPATTTKKAGPNPEAATRAYSVDEIKAVRKLAAETIYNDFDPEVRGASLKAALLNNIKAASLIIEDQNVLSVAIDPAIAPHIMEKFRNSFHRLIAAYNEFVEKDLIKGDKIQKNTEAARKKVSEKYTISTIHAIPIEHYLEHDADITELIRRYDFSDADNALEGIQKIPVPDDLGTVTDFFNDILRFYFKEQTLEDKRRIFSVVLRNTMPKPSDTDLARALVMGAGPIYQKYIQKLSDRLTASLGNPPDAKVLALRNALDVVKDGLLPNPLYETARNFLEIRRRTQDKVALTVKKQLGQASVGVAMLVDITDHGRVFPAVYKELRANIRDTVENESLFFARIAARHGLSKTYERKRAEIAGEMDLEHELDNVQLAMKYYNDSPLVSEHFKDRYPGAKDLIRAITYVDLPRSPQYYAMHVAPGESIKAFLARSHDPKNESERRREKIELLVITQLLNELVEKWTMVGFFLGNSGAFHGDLHSGNIFVDVDADWYAAQLKHLSVDKIDIATIRKMMHTPGNEERQLLTMIDFGIMPTVTGEERGGLVNVLVAALESQSAEGFVQGLEAISSDLKREFQNPKRRNQIKEGIEAQFHSNSRDVMASIVTFLGQAQVDLPPLFVNFSDAMLMLENTFDRLQKRMEHLKFYDESMTDLFQFKKILGSTIEGNLGFVPLWPKVRAGLRYIFGSQNVASPYAPTLNSANREVMRKKKLGY